jgi:hypothetical protein
VSANGNGLAHSDDKPFKLIEYKMEVARNDAIRELNRQLYGPEAFGFTSTKTYPPIRKYQRAWWRVRGYFQTLWLALKGAELEPPHDDY